MIRKIGEQFLLFDLKKYSPFPEWDEYEVYHDESKENKLVHGFLFVPTRAKGQLLREIGKIRNKYNCDSRLHYSDLTGRVENIKHKTVRDLIKIMCDAFRVRRFDHNVWGNCPPRCKFALFMKGNVNRMSSSYFATTNTSKKEVDVRKVETLMRIGLKGALHYLFDENSKIKIKGFYTDGLAWHRPLDKNRVLQRLYQERRKYIDFDSDLDILPIESNHKDSSCTDYDRSQLLQVCDCVLGAFMNCIFGGEPSSFKTKLATPVRHIMNKAQKRKSNFRYSGHFRSFVVTRAFLRNSQWEYIPLEPVEIESVSKELQQHFYYE